MYCPKCGARLNETDQFCQNCGEAVNPSSDRQPDHSGDQAVQSAEYFPKEQAAPREQNTDSAYYDVEFRKIAAGEPSKFNWAAFLFAPYHQLFHHNFQVFKKVSLPILILVMLGMAAQTASAVFALRMSLEGTMLLGGAALLLSAVAGFAQLIAGIWYGKRCNTQLYALTGGDASQLAKDRKKVCIFVAILVLWVAAMGLATSVGTKMAMKDLLSEEIEESDSEADGSLLEEDWELPVEDEPMIREPIIDEPTLDEMPDSAPSAVQQPMDAKEYNQLMNMLITNTYNIFCSDARMFFNPEGLLNDGTMYENAVVDRGDGAGEYICTMDCYYTPDVTDSDAPIQYFPIWASYLVDGWEYTLIDYNYE